MSVRRSAIPVVLALIAGCGGETPTTFAATDAPVAAQGGPPSGFARVQVRPRIPARARGGVTSSLAQAVEQVADGGEIVVYPGEYVTEDVLVDRSVVLRGEPGAVIVNRSGLTSLVLAGDGDTRIEVSGLSFRNEASAAGPGFYDQSASIDLAPGYGTVHIEGSTFEADPGEGIHIFTRSENDAPNPRFVLRDNTFVGGFRALRLSAQTSGMTPVDFEISGNEFSGTSNVALALFRVGGSVMHNDFESCGTWCVQVYRGPGVEVVQNSFRECTPGSTGGVVGCVQFATADEGLVAANTFVNRNTNVMLGTIFFFTSTFADGGFVAEGNVIDGCGAGNCITTDGWTHATIRGNDVTAYAGDGTGFGILSSGFTAPGNDVIENNTIRGLGPTDPANGVFPIESAGIFVSGGTHATMSGNTVSGALFGLLVARGPTVVGRDNVFSEVRHAIFSVEGGGHLEISNSDFAPSGLGITGGPDPLTGDLTCNWWGDAEAEALAQSTLPGGSTVSVEPFSTTPIAGSGRTNCTGTFPAETVTWEARFEVRSSRYLGNDPGIATQVRPAGSTGTVTFTWDPGAAPDPGGSPGTVYPMNTMDGHGIRFEFDDGLVWETTPGNGFYARVVDRTAGADVVRFQSDDAPVPIAGLVETDFIWLSFGDLSGDAISDESLPASFDLADWPSPNNIDLRAVDLNGSEYRILAELTSLTRAN